MVASSDGKAGENIVDPAYSKKAEKRRLGASGWMGSLMVARSGGKAGGSSQWMGWWLAVMGTSVSHTPVR